MPAIETIQLRRGTAALWASTNPVLASGEMGYETDTGKFKIGSGATPWNSLGYANPSGSGGATNLSATRTASQVVVVSDTGGDATLDAADTTNAGVLSAADKMKLNGLSQYTDAQADTRVAAGITGKLDISAAPELIRDTMGTALVPGANVTITPNDAGDTITIASGGASLPSQTGHAGEFLTTNGTAASWSGTSGGMADLVSDTTPQLGGDLDPNGHKILSRIVTIAYSATPAINTDVTDIFGITALNTDITSFSTNLTGSPTNGQMLAIYIIPTATRQIAWGASFENGTALLPTATNGTQRLDVLLMWNPATSKWRCMESSYNAPIVSSGTSLTLSPSVLRYVFTGTSTGNWTLPSVASSIDTEFVIHNRGTATLTVTRTSPDNVWTTAAVFNVTIPVGATAVLYNDGTYWVVRSPAQALYEPRIGSVREAATGNKTFEFWSEASAVNYLVTQSKAAGSGPNIQVAGTDTDAHLNVFPKGTGALRITVASGQTPTLAGNISGGGSGNLALTSPGAGGYITVNGARAGTRAPLVNTVGSSATPVINVDTTDLFTITALGVAITSMSSGLTGTPVNGQRLTVRIKDNGSAKAIAWGASWRAVGVTLPTTTVASKTLYVTAVWNTGETTPIWDVIDVKQEA